MGVRHIFPIFAGLALKRKKPTPSGAASLLCYVLCPFSAHCSTRRHQRRSDRPHPVRTSSTVPYTHLLFRLLLITVYHPVRCFASSPPAFFMKFLLNVCINCRFFLLRGQNDRKGPYFPCPGGVLCLFFLSLRLSSYVIMTCRFLKRNIFRACRRGYGQKQAA